jgi:methionine synthase I (cobalamin-dependent)
MNRQAVRIAREVAHEGDALVAGNVCNTWAYDPDDPATGRAVRAMYAEQLGWAVEEGIDFVISETNDYLGEALIALEVTRDLGLPAMVTLAPTQPDRRGGQGRGLPAQLERVTRRVYQGVKAWMAPAAARAGRPAR